ncbi:MAG: hypothetical protein LBM04_10685 [Opitutaceae bacterium]|jgi:hypothetical protein|nr:hypothetical protein [Opitutaceae bacterium]
MNLTFQLKQKPVRAAPDVWVKRVIIYSELKPTPTPIREVSLRKGLNIVWAEEPESSLDDNDIAGHSAGKTTFCRILRYILGEKTFANKRNTQAIKSCFPSGYVAAELHVKKKSFAVLRPIGMNRSSYVMEGGSIEEIIEGRGVNASATQETYVTKLGLAAIVESEKLKSATVARTNQPIQWDHLLAWCTRDQEVRFQNIYEWRSSRSDSEWPAFRFPKSDPLFVMRLILGLFIDAELRAEETLAQMQQKYDKDAAEIERLRMEPEYWRDYSGAELRRQLKELLPSDAANIEMASLISDDPSSLFPDLKKFVDKVKYELSVKLDQLERQLRELQKNMDTVNESLAPLKTEYGTIQELLETNNDISKESEQAVRVSQIPTSDKKRLCPYGLILVGNCTHIKDRDSRNPALSIKQKHIQEQAAANLSIDRKSLQARLVEIAEEIKDLETKRNNLSIEFVKLTAGIAENKNLSTSISDRFVEYSAWTERSYDIKKYAKLKEKAEALETLKENIFKAKTELKTLLTTHNKNRKLIEEIFSQATRSVLPKSNYDGVVSFEDRMLNFQIIHRTTMSGEAIETLAVLLSDLSCMIYSIYSENSLLPSFLIHDSPREADLGLRIYHSFIRFTAGIHEKFQTAGDCPFQYILTTTTPPPKDMQTDEIVRLKLDASKKNELLFRRNLANPPDDSQPEQLLMIE